MGTSSLAHDSHLCRTLHRTNLRIIANFEHFAHPPKFMRESNCKVDNIVDIKMKLIMTNFTCAFPHPWLPHHFAPKVRRGISLTTNSVLAHICSIEAIKPLLERSLVSSQGFWKRFLRN